MSALTDVFMAHRIERCSVSSANRSEQWGRCTGCDFESISRPLKGVNWDVLQRDIYAAHIEDVIADTRLALVELPEPDDDDEWYEDSWFLNSELAVRTYRTQLAPGSARRFAAALLAAANAAEAGDE